MVTAADLEDQFGMPYPRPILHCRWCGNECSAHAGDYWNSNPDIEFWCCDEPMHLVVKRVKYEEVLP